MVVGGGRNYGGNEEEEAQQEEEETEEEDGDLTKEIEEDMMAKHMEVMTMTIYPQKIQKGNKNLGINGGEEDKNENGSKNSQAQKTKILKILFDGEKGI